MLLLQILTGDHLAGILSCIKEVCRNSAIFQSRSNLLSLLKGLQHMCESSCEFNVKFIKSKVTDEISNIYKVIFTQENKEYIETEMIEIALETLKTILMSMKNNDKTFTNKNPAKLMFEEKAIFEFIEILGTNFKNNSKLLLNIINSYMKYSVKDQHQEAYARRVIIMIYNLVVQGFVSSDATLSEVLPVLESRLLHFVNMRYYEDEAMLLSSNTSDAGGEQIK